MDAPVHVAWLADTGERQQTACGREIEIWSLSHEEDEAVLSAWAKHFRQHYITDEDLPEMVDGTELDHAAYLRTIVFPDRTATPGPSLRSGDFAEILVADYIGFVLGYWCPRELRYQDRWNRQDSTRAAMSSGSNSPRISLHPATMSCSSRVQVGPREVSGQSAAGGGR